MDDLKADYTIVIVTHNMQQARRVSDMTACMMLDDLAGGNGHRTGDHRRVQPDRPASSPTPRTPGPRPTSPAGSAEAFSNSRRLGHAILPRALHDDGHQACYNRGRRVPEGPSLPRETSLPCPSPRSW